MRRRYEDTDDLQTAIAAELDIDRASLNRLAKKLGWKLRKDRPPRDLSPAVRLAIEAEHAIRAKLETEAEPPASAATAVEPEQEKANADAPALPSMAERLERAVDRELRAVELMRAVGGPQSSADAERTARTLASLTETLHRVRRLRTPETPATRSDDFDIPTDIDEFRRVLAQRIRNFVRSRTGGAISPAGDAGESVPPE
jgi:hypothetical protein